MTTTSATVAEVRTTIDGFGSDHVILRRDHDGGMASMIVSHRDENPNDHRRTSVPLNIAQIDEMIAGLTELKRGLGSAGRGGMSSEHELGADIMAERAGRLIGSATPVDPEDVNPGDSVIIRVNGTEYYDQVRAVEPEGEDVTLTLWRLGAQSVPAGVRIPVRRG